MFKLFFIKLLGGKAALELSYSKISAYNFCPWKYKLVYENGLKISPTPSISLGLSVHKTLEEYHRAGSEKLDDLLEIYNRVWVNEGFQTPQQTMQFYEKGEQMLRNYYDQSLNRKSEIVAVEKEFSFPVGKRILRGIIDRIDKLPDDTYEVIDYKTHAEMWEQDRIDADLQLTLYSLGCKQALNLEPSVFSYYFLAHNKVVSTQRTEIHEKEALKVLETVAQKIESKDFMPSTAQCPRCDFRFSCKHSSVKSVPKK